ncbi:MAG: hypothetical protein ACFFAN_13940 [Promethearchaeota archaeon]
MEVLEFKPIKNKIITVYMVKKAKQDEEINERVNLNELLNFINADFVTFDLDNENMINLRKSSLRKLLDELEIPYFPLEMPEYAKGYLFEEIMEKEEQINELLEEYISMKDKNSFKGQNLKSWIDILKKEVEKKKNFLIYKLRPQWIVKKILDQIKSKKKRDITIVHFVPKNIISEMIKLLQEYNVKVIIYENKVSHLGSNLIKNKEEIKQW